MKPRTFLGRDLVPILWTLAGYRTIFEIEDGLEVDEINLVTIERTRVYYDDVLGITYHRETGTGFLVVTGVFSLMIVLGLMIAAMSSDGLIPGVIVIVIGLLFAVAFVFRLAMKVDIITVYGRRTKAVIKFPFRKAYARDLYTTLVARVRARQAALIAAQPKPPAAPDVPLPPPPPQF